MARTFQVFVLFVSAASGGALAATPDQSPQRSSPQRSTKSVCEAWQARFERLSDTDRGLLMQYGILLRGSWIVSPSLVGECRDRVSLEDFFRAALAGSVGPSQRKFVRQHRATLSRVLRKVWPELGHSPAVQDDGAFNEEKWGILRHAELSSSDLTDLLRESLVSEGLSGAFVDFVLTNPQPGIEPDIEEIIQREEKATSRRDRTSTTEIYGLALLYSMGRNGIPEQLARLKASERTSQIERSVISVLVARIKAKERIHWHDMEVLESQS